MPTDPDRDDLHARLVAAKSVVTRLLFTSSSSVVRVSVLRVLDDLRPAEAALAAPSDLQQLAFAQRLIEFAEHKLHVLDDPILP